MHAGGSFLAEELILKKNLVKVLNLDKVERKIRNPQHTVVDFFEKT